MNAQSSLKGKYASRAKLRDYVEQARQLGLDVAAFEVSPDGTIRILSSAAFPAKPKDEFEAWEQAGKL